MPVSLYDTVVPSWLQILQSMRGLLDKAQAYCAEQGVAEADILDARLAEDMFPFAAQIVAAADYSFGTVKGLHAGVYPTGGPSEIPATIAGLKAVLDAAVAGLEQVTAEEMENFVGQDMRFALPAYNIDMPFTAEHYLFSFAQPNFYFHATTAYDILRGKGLAIGKMDFLGPVRIKAN
ncbi:MAG: DUF1993 family protein [Sphingobium sp.]